MPIPPHISALFPSDTRERGQQYFRRGVVRIVAVDEEGITATVRGAELYHVQVRLEPDGDLVHSCSCPAWDTYGVCKHVWATLLAADLQRLLRFDGSTEPRSRSIPAPTASRASWKRQLGRIRNRVPEPMPGLPDATFPGERRIVYVVDLVSTRLHQRGLVVELATQKRLADGEWSPPKQFGLREDQWANAPDPLDRQIAQMLVGAGSDSRYLGHGVTRRYYLTPAAFDTTLRLMCETGRCRVSVSGEADPAPLAWDAGGRHMNA
jgi:hypothetical protein